MAFTLRKCIGFALYHLLPLPVPVGKASYRDYANCNVGGQQ